MDVPNINSAALVSNHIGNSASAPVAAPRTTATQVDLPQAAVKSEPTPAQVQNMVDGANKAMRQINASLEFSVDEATNKTVIQVTEKQTGQVIMQFPTDEMLAITRAIDSAQQGILLKQQA